MNILIEGTRGKSGVVKIISDAINSNGIECIGKITGKETKVFYKGKSIIIPRKNGKFFLDDENKRIMKKYKHCRYMVFENQALSAYTMRAIHNLLKPEILVIPNIRFEHQDQLGEDVFDQALSFALNIRGAKYLVTTERKKQILSILKKYCIKFNCKFIPINFKSDLPGIEAIYLCEAVLKILGLKLSVSLKRNFISELESNMNLKFSRRLGVWYFFGSKINDIESMENVFNRLKKQKGKFCFVCYLRRDRPERTEAFQKFFDGVDNDPRIKKVFIAGHNYKGINYKGNISRFSGKKEEIIAYCKKNKLKLITAINGVNDFMKDLESYLSK